MKFYQEKYLTNFIAEYVKQIVKTHGMPNVFKLRNKKINIKYKRKFKPKR